MAAALAGHLLCQDWIQLVIVEIAFGRPKISSRPFSCYFSAQGRFDTTPRKF
ncbi:MAG: hypothetical protein ACP5PX_05615 [Candidatus Hadarchaeum sp.]|uniref:hypothetical protein n=1 Tax=Candidatus Hadarchaeum sp. TaxID=2883567 RepID=UPI003D0AEB45